MGTAAGMRTYGVPGKVVLLGTPAEEGGAGKVKLLEAGACELNSQDRRRTWLTAGDKEMDICMMQHPAGLPAGLEGAIGVTSAIQTIEIEYFGKSAHAAAAPCKSGSHILGDILKVRGWCQRP
jgi:metal-dependent amidase/aminoacylase/carboxypeptidase family protein